jgi:hypothetical protein
MNRKACLYGEEFKLNIESFVSNELEKSKVNKFPCERNFAFVMNLHMNSCIF